MAVWLADLLRAVSEADGSIDYLELSPYALAVDSDKHITKLEFRTVESDVPIADAGFTDDFWCEKCLVGYAGHIVQTTRQPYAFGNLLFQRKRAKTP